MIHDLYQEVILDHGKNPRNFYKMTTFTNYAKGYNPFCGDQIEIFLQVRAELVEKISFQGNGCIICLASASLLTESVCNRTTYGCDELIVLVQNMLVKRQLDENKLGKLVSLKNIIKFPARVKCATLAWHALDNALKHIHKIVTTEKNE